MKLNEYLENLRSEKWTVYEHEDGYTIQIVSRYTANDDYGSQNMIDEVNMLIAGMEACEDIDSIHYEGFYIEGILANNIHEFTIEE